MIFHKLQKAQTSKRRWLGHGLALLCFLAMLFVPQSLQNARANGDTRSLNMFHNHTGERITITYKIDGRYDPDALEKLNWFLRDWRKNKSIAMDPELLDLVWEVYRDLGASAPIHIICGYRDEMTNEMLRGRSFASGVAEHSQHTHGRAMDISIPGVSTERLREMGFLKQRGGVGYYRSSGFVHLDVANVRAWPRMTTQQLASLFPDGETLHLPSDGPPLRGYQIALARYGRDGKSGRSGDYAVASASPAAPRGLLRQRAPDIEQQIATPVVKETIVKETAPSLSARLGPVIAALPAPKDTSRLEQEPERVALLAPVKLPPAQLAMTAPLPRARPALLAPPLVVASAEVPQVAASLKPAILSPSPDIGRHARTQAARMTAPRYNIQTAFNMKPKAALTPPRLQLAAQFMDAPMTRPEQFVLRGVMKQASAKKFVKTAQL